MAASCIKAMLQEGKLTEGACPLLRGGSMNAATEQKALVQTLVDEASDVDLVCYLAHSGGEIALKDFLECIRDAETLSIDDLLHNIGVVRQKKTEAYACPMHRVFRRLMRSDTIPSVSSMPTEGGFSPHASLH
jgi:hypothetical protein